MTSSRSFATQSLVAAVFPHWPGAFLYGISFVFAGLTFGRTNGFALPSSIMYTEVRDDG